MTSEPTDRTPLPSDEMRLRPWDEFRTSGLLWLVNTSVFHPRGYAIAMAYDADGACTGWKLRGDGTEVWEFGPKTTDEQFEASRRTLTPGKTKWAPLLAATAELNERYAAAESDGELDAAVKKLEGMLRDRGLL